MIVQVLFALALHSSISVLGQPQETPAIDLNGVWKAEDDTLIEVTQSGASVTTRFITGGVSTTGKKLAYFIAGQLSGATLSGTMMRYQENKKLLKSGAQEVFTTSFTATVSESAISGTFKAQSFLYKKESGGKYIGLRRNPGGDKDTNFSMALQPCDKKDHWEEYKRKWATGQELLVDGNKHMEEADKEYHDWKIEETKVMGELSVEKYDLLQTIELALAEGGKHLLHSAVGWFGVVTSAAWIYTDVYPHVRDHTQAIRDSAKMTDNGYKLANKALDDILADLAKSASCKKEHKQAEADQKLLDDAKALRDQWEIEGSSLYSDPNDTSGYPMDAAAALKRAKDILSKPPSGSLTRFLMPEQDQQGDIVVTVQQLRDALAQVEKAEQIMKAGEAKIQQQRSFESKRAEKLKAAIEKMRQAHGGEPIG